MKLDLILFSQMNSLLVQVSDIFNVKKYRDCFVRLHMIFTSISCILFLFCHHWCYQLKYLNLSTDKAKLLTEMNSHYKQEITIEMINLMSLSLTSYKENRRNVRIKFFGKFWSQINDFKIYKIHFIYLVADEQKKNFFFE